MNAPLLRTPPHPRVLLLTPGPLTTAPETRAAMDRDWGSRDGDFATMSEGVRTRLCALASGAPSHVCVMLQGSGTYAIEATIGTLVPRDGKLLVLVNGAYGRRAVEIARRMGRAVAQRDWPEDRPVDAADVDAALAEDPAVTDVLLVHLETTSGLVNPLHSIASVVARHGRRLLVDAMASFGAIPLDVQATPMAAVIASSNKCLEGVPGIGFAVTCRTHLAACAGNAPGVSLDLHAQWQGFEATKQWRFTPPTHVLAALSAALDGLEAEGGVAARCGRYAANRDVLLDGLGRLGFRPYLDASAQGPIIVTFRLPPGLDFEAMYAALHARGVVLYPGKLTSERSFRIGCIGAVDAEDMRRAVSEIERYLARGPQFPTNQGRIATV